MRFEVIEEDETRVRGVLLGDDGKEIGQKAILKTDLEEEMRKTRRGRKRALGKLAGASVQAVKTESVTLEQTVDDDRLTLDDLEPLFAPHDHAHELPEHEHPHRHENLEAAFVALEQRHSETVKRLDAVAAENAELRSKLEEHRHRALEERLNTAEALEDAQSRRLEAVEARPAGVTSLEGYVTADELMERLSALTRGLTTLDGVTVERLNQLSARIDSIPQPEQGLSAQDVKALIAEAEAERPQARYTVRELSHQKVNGKKRFVVEEA